MAKRGRKKESKKDEITLPIDEIRVFSEKLGWTYEVLREAISSGIMPMSPSVGLPEASPEVDLQAGKVVSESPVTKSWADEVDAQEVAEISSKGESSEKAAAVHSQVVSAPNSNETVISIVLEETPKLSEEIVNQTVEIQLPSNGVKQVDA